jgi:hypothetical protein
VTLQLDILDSRWQPREAHGVALHLDLQRLACAELVGLGALTERPIERSRTRAAKSSISAAPFAPRILPATDSVEVETSTSDRDPRLATHSETRRAAMSEALVA